MSIETIRAENIWVKDGAETRLNQNLRGVVHCPCAVETYTATGEDGGRAEIALMLPYLGKPAPIALIEQNSAPWAESIAEEIYNERKQRK